MKTMTNIKEVNFCKKVEPLFKMLAAEQSKLLAAPKHTRIAEVVNVLLEEAHKLEDLAAAKGDVYLRRAVDKAIGQVHQIADVLESLEHELTEAASYYDFQ
jgi:hypothetical protein